MTKSPFPLVETADIFAAVTALMNVADALFTILEHHLGVQEMNPLMGGVLALGIPTFLLCKVLVVQSLVLYVWWAGKRKPWAVVGLAVTAALYCLLFLVHAHVLLACTR